MLSCPNTTLARGKRSRSNSSSSSSSSITSSSSASESIFSHFTSTESASSLSNYSSPAGSSNAASPVVDRPYKLSKGDTGSSSDIALDNLVRSSALDKVAISQSVESEKPIVPSSRTQFVDCLVDAAVQVLDIIWEAPLSRSISFVCDEKPSASTLIHEDIIRSPKCNVGQVNPQQSIPLELFVRETLRRSRTSCSTLQAALLFCKRAGGEVVRRRAQQEGLVLTAEQMEKLPGSASFYPSLSSNALQSSNDYLLCNRRTFLASVMISSKFLQDRTFSNRAWSKISGLDVQELSRVERRVLMALEFNLNVCETTWNTWTNFLKLQWKASRPSTRCGMPHTHSLPAVKVTAIRSALVRTNSLPEGPGALEAEVLDADVSLPSGDQHAFFANDATLLHTSLSLPCDETTSTEQPTPLSKPNDADISTPTLRAQGSVGGDSTPTSSIAAPRKSGHSLLSIALLHHHLQVCS